MRVRVKLFAAAKDLAGCDELIVEMPSGATVAELRETVISQYPRLAKLVPHALWAVNADYANDKTQLNEQSNVALIPPVSGG